MMPVIAGPPYAVAPSFRKLTAISFQCLANAPRCLLVTFAVYEDATAAPRSNGQHEVAPESWSNV